MSHKNYRIYLIIVFLSSCATGLKNVELESNISMTETVEYEAIKHGEIPRDSSFSFDFLRSRKIIDLQKEISRIEEFNSKGELRELYIEKLKDNKPISGETYNSNNELVEFWKTQEKKKENIKFYNTYNSEGDLIRYREILYNNENLKISENSNYLPSNELYKTEFEYYSNGKLAKKIIYKSNGKIRSTISFEYDENGYLKNRILKNPEYEGYSITIFEYNNKKHNIKQLHKDHTGKLYGTTSFEYVYDLNGNWITKKQLENNKLYHIWQRRVKYFN